MSIKQCSIIKCAAVALLVISQAAIAAVPAPYTPVKASRTEFRCLGRSTKLGEMLLPAQITAAGQHELSSPVRLSVGSSPALQDMRGKSRLVERKDEIARWEWDGQSRGFRITATMSGECDGFSWYQITLTPKKPLTLDTLQLQVPRIAKTARYIHAANYGWGGQNGAQQTSRGLAELGGKWSSAFMPFVWLGDEARGLGWTCESDQGWNLNDPKNALQVVTDGNTVLFATNLLDHAEKIDSPIVLKFGLMATPVKPVSFAWRAQHRIYHGIEYSSDVPGPDGKCLLDKLQAAGVNTVVYHDSWAQYFGQTTPASDTKFRKLIDECHKRNIKIIVYIGYGLARNAPEMKGHHDDWSVMPLIPWTSDWRPYYRAFDATCANSGWADWLEKGIDKLFTDYKLDGLYFDGTTEAWRCENTAHGCGWRDSSGKLHGTYPVLAVRKMMRRIADIVHKHRKDGILDVHTSASVTEPTLSFCDSYWDGEQYESYTSADQVEIPLDTFKAEFMGYAHGLNSEFLCYENRPFSITEAIAIAWLHGVEVRPDSSMTQLEKVSQIWKAMDKFGATKAKWIPYWSGSGVAAPDNFVKASTYVRNGAALLFVSHLKRTNLTTTLTLDRQRLGLPSGPLTAVNALTGEKIDVTGDKLPVTFDGMTYRLIEVKGAQDNGSNSL